MGTLAAVSWDEGILSDPLDVSAPQPRGLSKRELFVDLGITLTARGTGVTGSVIRFVEGAVLVLRDASGKDHSYAPTDGFFLHEGDGVRLRAPRAKKKAAPTITASGSVSAGDAPARIARGGRIWVEGIHDAELIERIWGDDLRYEGVVVEQLDGADDLAERVRGFRPQHNRRLGVLLDHLVKGSKESRIAAEVNDPNVLIVGHPYVDIWAAIKPSAVGIEAWPDVPKGEPWKEGILARLKVNVEPAQFWKHVLGRANGWTDVETPLVTAVEQLIDFVTTEG